MKKMRKIGLVILISTIMLATICGAKAQTQTTENMQTFFDREIPGIKIIVNATAETQPNKNITVNLTMKPLKEEVNIKYFNFSVFGFINGTYKTMMYNIVVNSFPFNATFPVPEQVWGATYGEIMLAYNITYVLEKDGITQITIIPYENFIGFPMTSVRNVYLETIEEQLRNLNSTFEQLNQTFRQYSGKDLTPENLNNTLQEYRLLQGSQSELGNVRMAVAVLAITTVFFVATTAYLVLRRPRKESW
jgi:hypothetical protein